LLKVVALGRGRRVLVKLLRCAAKKLVCWRPTDPCLAERLQHLHRGYDR